MSSAVWLAIAASTLWGLGMALQKQGMSSEFPKITLRTLLAQIGTVVRTLFTHPTWIAGLLVTVAGMFVYAYALSRGDITVVQPLVNLSMVVAAFVGVLFLGERVGAIEWTGIGVMLVGVALVSAGGGRPTSVQPSTPALAALTGVFCALAGASLLPRALGLHLRIEFTFSIGAGCFFGLANVMGKVLTQRVASKVGVFSLANLDCWGALLADFPIWTVLGANVLAGLLLQTAFANGRVSLIAPIQSIVANTSPVLAAIAVFGERVGWQRGCGIALAVIGTGMLSLRKEAEGTGQAGRDGVEGAAP